MAFIEVDELVREFRSHRRFPGALGALRSLVTRQYDVRRALDDVSFTIERGEAVGYVGPNGAGKSTTVKILTGILVPTAGIARVGGRVPHLHRIENARRMGVVFGQRSQLWWDLPLEDSFELHRHVYRVPPERFRRMLAFCEELLGIGDFRRFPVRQLSLGQRMRGELALALLHEPEVLFLDEPTIGLDVLVKDRVRSFLRQANREFGVTILLTTHDLRDIEEICPRLLVIDRGRIVWDGAVTELKSRFARLRTLTVEFEVDPGPVSLEDAQLVRDDGRHKTFRFDRQATNMPRLLAELMRRYQLEDAAIGEADIEEVIRQLYIDLGRERPPEAEEIDTWSRGQPLTR
jgi:ABC-2 type transport system ATP-binding protein